MPRYKYSISRKLASSFEEIEIHLNEEGSKGWELVSVAEDPTSFKVTCYWRKEIREQEEKTITVD